MHIGIDAHAIGAQQGGNETYIRNLLHALAELDGENRYTIYLANAEAARQWRDRYANFAVRVLPPPTPLVRVPLALAVELRRRPVDVLHVQYTAPPFCPVPVVATIHDLSFEHLPETFTRRGRAQLRLTVRRTARKAARILTISEFSRQDIIRTYHLPPEKVALTYIAAGKQFSSQLQTADESARIRQRFGISRDFLLALGSLQPRKNLLRLLRAYARLREQQPDFNLQLVIAGRRLWLTDEIFSALKNYSWAEDVIVTGYVADEELPALYRAATALVYPSLFEGFGLPPLEAMACGTPVVTSNTSSLPEVAGNAAVLIDPHDEVSLAEGIWKVVTDESLRRELRTAGIKQARRFTWREAAEKTREIYYEAAARSHSTTMKAAAENS